MQFLGSRYYRIAALIILLIAAVLALRACGQPTPPSDENPQTTATAVPPTPVTEVPTATVTITSKPPPPGFVEDQLIVVGRRQDIERVLSRYRDQGNTRPPTQSLAAAGGLIEQAQEPVTRTRPVSIELKPDQSLELSRFYPPPSSIPSTTPAPPSEMSLYHLAAPADVTDTVSAVSPPEVAGELNRLAAEMGVKRFGADPNYVLGAMQPGVGADDPWIIKGGPFEVPVTATNAATDFIAQWALGTGGIGLYLNGSRAITTTGSGIQVTVFDTSPFTITDGTSAQTTISSNPPATDPASTLNLTVTHPAAQALAASANADRREHGVYVASLVHAVAPGAGIELIRVLNADGLGDLWALNRAMYDRLGQVAAGPGLRNHTVFNLSLGFVRPSPPNPSPSGPQPGDATFGAPIGVVTDTNPVASLATLTEVAESLGVLVVAAAGNDSRGGAPMPMQVPADLPSVVGVGATNVSSQAACFSNAGDTWAPGGDGLDLAIANQNCEPPMTQCDGEANHAHCLIGLTSSGAFAYWAGTSFATSLVAGMGALLLEGGHSVSETRQALTQGHGSPASGLTISSVHP